MALIRLALAGAVRVIVTEVAPARIASARRLGFTVLNAADTDVAKQVLESTDQRGSDIVSEATGHPSVAPHLLELVKIQEQIVEVGVLKQPAPIDLRTLNFHEVDLTGSWVYATGDFERAIVLAADERIDLNSMPARLFPLAESVGGFPSA